VSAFTANGRIQPRGRPTTYHVEYGATTAYGSKTVETALPPRIGAYYHESFDSSVAGWQGGLGGDELQRSDVGGFAGGFVSFSEPTGVDSNHEDGIGYNELNAWLEMGTYFDPSAPNGGSSAAWGGGQADLRGARVTTYVRGRSWVGAGSEL